MAGKRNEKKGRGGKGRGERDGVSERGGDAREVCILHSGETKKNWRRRWLQLFVVRCRA